MVLMGRVRIKGAIVDEGAFTYVIQLVQMVIVATLLVLVLGASFGDEDTCEASLLHGIQINSGSVLCCGRSYFGT
jgi:hypothetical protein